MIFLDASSVHHLTSNFTLRRAVENVLHCSFPRSSLHYSACSDRGEKVLLRNLIPFKNSREKVMRIIRSSYTKNLFKIFVCTVMKIWVGPAEVNLWLRGNRAEKKETKIKMENMDKCSCSRNAILAHPHLWLKTGNPCLEGWWSSVVLWICACSLIPQPPAHFMQQNF